MRLLMSVALLAVAAVSVRGDDWPQWMGPKRDNVWRETGILEKFPAGGPKVLWKAPISGGYAGPAVANGKVYVGDYTSKDLTTELREEGNFDRKEVTGIERFLCFDEKTGEQIWKYEYPVKYGISYPSGPRCTPLVHEGKVYVLGAEGHLACLDATSGSKVWAKELKVEYKTKSGLWGYAAHPQIDGKKLITIAGGEGSHAIALDKDTGAEIWKSQTQQEGLQGYSPPLLTEAGGVRQLIVAGSTALRGLDPETGKRLWTTPMTADNACVVMTPVRSGDLVFVGAYNAKNLLVKLLADKPDVEVLFKDKKDFAMSPVNTQPFLHEGVLYGYDDTGKMYGIELPSGKRLWESGGPVAAEPKASGTAFIVKNGERFLFFADTGFLTFGKLTPTGYEEIDRAKVIEPTNGAWGRKVVWCAPAYANKHMYVRNDKELICLDLAK